MLRNIKTEEVVGFQEVITNYQRGDALFRALIAFFQFLVTDPAQVFGLLHEASRNR